MRDNHVHHTVDRTSKHKTVKAYDKRWKRYITKTFVSDFCEACSRSTMKVACLGLGLHKPIWIVSQSCDDLATGLSYEDTYLLWRYMVQVIRRRFESCQAGQAPPRAVQSPVQRMKQLVELVGMTVDRR